jgi:hypothetical protein
MSVVSRSASRANGRRTELPTNRKQAGFELADGDSDKRNIAPRSGLESQARSQTGIQPLPGTCAYITGFEKLSKLGVGFYPIRPDKSPAIQGKLDRVATTDLIKLQFWVEHHRYRSFALRILTGSRLIVIDTESPSKQPGNHGPDGELILYGLLEEHAITLPLCPMVETASGGFHRYLLVPKWLPIRRAISLWPGIDILAAGSSVILPGSRTVAGRYKPLRSFEECPIPEAPRELIRLIRQAQGMRPRGDRSLLGHSQPLPSGDNSSVSPRQWWLLFRNRVFRALWNRRGKLSDCSDSAYEYHLVKACFCCGLDQLQAVTVILKWRQTHGLRRSLRKLRSGIIPAAWREVSNWVNGWRADQEVAVEARKATKTASMILAHMSALDTPQTPLAIAVALGIPRERAKKAMQRLSKKAQVLRTTEGYTVIAGANASKPSPSCVWGSDTAECPQGGTRIREETLSRLSDGGDLVFGA